MKNIVKKIDFKDKKTVKKLIALIVVLVVVITGIITINVNKSHIQADLLYAIMPDTVDLTENNGFPFLLYKQKNEDFDFKEDIDEPMNAVQFYYYDENDEKVIVNGADTIKYNGEDYGSPYIAFMINSVDTFNQIKKVISVIFVIICVLIVIGIIFLWFKSWSKRQDKEKEKKYANKNNKQNKKSEKK